MLCQPGQTPDTGSGSQAVTAFGTTTLEYQTSLGSGHTGTETMGTLALEDAGLESSFHEGVPVNMRK